MKLEGNTITFESEALAKQALADLKQAAAIRRVGEEMRQGFKEMSQEEIDEMNRENLEHLEEWDRGMCPVCNPPKDAPEDDEREDGRTERP